MKNADRITGLSRVEIKLYFGEEEKTFVLTDATVELKNGTREVPGHGSFREFELDGTVTISIEGQRQSSTSAVTTSSDSAHA